jgi:hypothetical protein
MSFEMVGCVWCEEFKAGYENKVRTIIVLTLAYKSSKDLFYCQSDSSLKTPSVVSKYNVVGRTFAVAIDKPTADLPSSVLIGVQLFPLSALL